jgi:prepilin-type N-terminal cleavage/methylation domain-containing protein
MTDHRYRAGGAGFTLVEILLALVIVGVLATLAVMLTRDKLDDGKVTAALTQMDGIRRAVADGFYRDFGFIPEEVHRTQDDPDSGSYHTLLETDVPRNQNPEYATRFLCMERDCTNEEITDLLSVYSISQTSSLKMQAQKWGGDSGRLGCAFMARALYEVRDNTLTDFLNDELSSLRYLMMPDPSVGRRGWAGPYLACNSWINATALHRTDGDRYPAVYYSDPKIQHIMGPYAEAVTKDVYFPVITTPWADDLEAAARKAEADQNPDLARELRKGRYYQILVYSTPKYWYYNVAGAVAFSYSSDSPASVGDDLGVPEAQVPETAVVISRGADGLAGSAGDASAAGGQDCKGAEGCWMKCAQMSQYGPTDAQRACFRNLATKDIGDDLLLFIFGSGPVRSPLDK